MDRRTLLAVGSAWAAIGGRVNAAPPDLRGAAREAWIYCLPLVQMAGARWRMTRPGPLGQDARVNTFVHCRALAGPASRAITTPNSDTLYSSAWIDLSSGPATITLPPTRGRYFSLALLDMFTNTLAVFGGRDLLQGGRHVTLVGPGGPEVPGAIRSPTPWVWARGRTLVEGDADLASAHAVQDALMLFARSGRSPPQGPGPDAAWTDYFRLAQQILADNPPPPEDQALFARIAPLQLGPRRGFETARFADVEMEAVSAGVADARGAVMALRRSAASVGGWVWPKPDLGNFGQDWLYRAAVAISRLGALPPTRALCLDAAAPEGGTVFNGDSYSLTMRRPPPADGFWSLTMYQVLPDGRRFLVDNPLGRYAIGDRTGGLMREADGDLVIWISRDDPGGARTANWLAAPARGPFALVLRAFDPRREMLDGAYRLTPVDQVSPRSSNT